MNSKYQEELSFNPQMLQRSSLADGYMLPILRAPRAPTPFIAGETILSPSLHSSFTRELSQLSVWMAEQVSQPWSQSNRATVEGAKGDCHWACRNQMQTSRQVMPPLTFGGLSEDGCYPAYRHKTLAPATATAYLFGCPNLLCGCHHRMNNQVGLGGGE